MFRRDPPTEFSNANLFGRELDPAIQAEFDALATRLNPVPSLFEAYAHIVRQSGWGEPQKAALRGATPEAFMEEIGRLSGEDLKLFMTKNVEMHVQRSGYEGHFGEASWAFVAACRAICQANSAPRLSNTIRMLFRNAEMASLLEICDHPRPRATPDR